MAERPVNPGDSPCSSEETRMEEPVVSREPAQAEAVVVQPNTTCAQCKKEVKSPHLLCCLHSVCVECLPGMAVEGQRIKCGECGDTSTHCSSSRKGVENHCGADIVHCVPVPNDPLSRYMEGVKIVGKASNQSSIPCGNKRCKTPDSPSTVYCTDCSIFMCERCNGAHELGPSYEDHSVKTLQEMRELIPDDCQKMFSKSPAANTCPRHRGRVLEYCCEQAQCSLLMCQACAVEFKPPHKPKEITTDSAIAEPHRQSLRAAHQATVCFGEKCEAVEKQLQTELRTVDQTTEASLVGLNTAFQSIHEAVERRKEELHRQIINAAEEKKRAIGSRLRSVESRKKTAGNAESTFEFLLKSGSTHDLLASKDLIQTHQSVLNSKWCEDELENTVSSVLSFEAANQEAALKAIAGFGIVTDGACPEKCTVEPNPEQLQLKGSDPVTLKVVTFDSKGIACTRGGDKIKAILHSKPTTPGPTIKARVVDNDNGTYSVSFPSVYPGPCVLCIEVNGRDIRGSPFDVNFHHPSSSHRKLSRNVRNINGPKGTLHFPQQPGDLYGVTVSPKGTIVVSEYSGHKIHVFSEEKKYITSFGTQGSGEDQLYGPYGLTVGSDELVYVANYNNSCVKVFREDGTFVRQIGSGELSHPWNVTIHNQQLYIADTGNHRVSVYTLQGQHVRTIGSQDKGPGQFSSPRAVAFSPDGDMYVADYSNNRVQVFDANGQYRREFGQGQLKNPLDILITINGEVFVSDQGSHRVAVFSTCGNTNNFIHSFGVTGTIYGLAIDNDGNILVSSSGTNQVTIF